MKILSKARVAALALLMGLAVSVAVAAKKPKTVERGMTKEQVTAIYGKPIATSFDEAGESWTFRRTRGGWLTQYDVSITVSFDNEGKVVACTEKVIGESNTADNLARVATITDEVRSAFSSGSRKAPLSASDFDQLLANVRNAPFTDRKLELVKVACMGGWLTCNQGGRLIAVFTFTDGKMKALNFIAPRLVDLQNANEIYKQFTFNVDKEKAAAIISQSR